jgi:glycosyltransferase involved in cell wall biosynthesis
MASVTIVIPALNEEKYLPHLLQSLAEQTCNDFSVVVVDGSSQDQTVRVAQSFSPRLAELNVIVSPQPNVARQRNLGARAARGEWLVFLDADGVVPPYFIERVQRFIAEQQPEFFTAWSAPDRNAAREAICTLLVNIVVEGGLAVQRPLAPGGLIGVRRTVFDQTGGFDETLTFGEDYNLTQRITARGTPLHVLRETIYAYSLRRMRKVGLWRFAGFYSLAIMRVLVTNQNARHAPGYLMGGQFFEATPARRKRLWRRLR